MTYTLGDLEALKSKPYTYGQGYALSTVEFDGAAWQPIGYISEEGIATTPEPAPSPPKCPHCNRDFHADPLTKRVANMVRNHKFDPTYKAAEDDSPVECVGSDVYGPNRPAYDLRTNAWVGNGGLIFDEAVSWSTATFDTLINQTIKWTIDTAWTTILGGKAPAWELPNYSFGLTYKTWFPEEPLECPPDLELDVQFGPAHWPVEHVALFPPHLDLVAKVHPDEWREPIPLPASPGLDVSTLVEEFNKKHNWNGVNK